MAINQVTIELLDAEILALAKAVPAFKNHGYSVMGVEDFDEKRGREALPVVGVAWDGAEPAPKDQNPNVASMSTRATVMQLTWTVIIAIEYRHNGQAGATRVAAHDLLDGLRQAISGFKGVNTRPWIWAGEGPIPDASGDGVVYYGQVWRTTVISSGTSNPTQ